MEPKNHGDFLRLPRTKHVALRKPFAQRDYLAVLGRLAALAVLITTKLFVDMPTHDASVPVRGTVWSWHSNLLPILDCSIGRSACALSCHVIQSLSQLIKLRLTAALTRHATVNLVVHNP